MPRGFNTCVMLTSVIAIFDIGKTNKKIILFDKNYKLVSEQTKQFTEIKDDNGKICEDIEAITLWIKDTIAFLQLLDNIKIEAFNVSAYGASFVHLDADFKLLTPLYNYLNPYPELLQKHFYETYGGEVSLSMQTASPVLGNLNSGLQLYRLKHERPQLFKTIHYSLHLPQYISHVITSMACTDITSIGCHTHLWDFKKNSYHDWVIQEGLDLKFPPLLKSDNIVLIPFAKNGEPVPAGGGLHDSSAALIPYFTTFKEPFILISTGTWCISLNPFNASPLTEEELKKDCLCYLSYLGTPVKASRLFAGNDHEQQTKRITTHFKTRRDYYKSIVYSHSIVTALFKSDESSKNQMKKGFGRGAENSVFESRDLARYDSFEEAYHQLMIDIITMQSASTELVLKNTSVKRIFVDGGFSKNSVYMNLLADSFPQMEVFGATVAQSTSLGAALAIHRHWNNLPIPDDLIDLKYYPRP